MTDASAETRPNVRALSELILSGRIGRLMDMVQPRAREHFYGALSMMTEDEITPVLAATRKLTEHERMFVFRVLSDHQDMYGGADLTLDDSVPPLHREMGMKLQCAVFIAPVMGAFGYYEHLSLSECHMRVFAVIQWLDNIYGERTASSLLSGDDDTQNVARGLAILIPNYSSFLHDRATRQDEIEDCRRAGEQWRALAPYADLIHSRYNADHRFLQQLLDNGSTALGDGVL